MRKSALFVLLYILIMLISVSTAFAQTENMLISPARLEKVPIGYGSYGIGDFYKLFDNEKGEETVDISMIDTYPNSKVKLFFLNTIHIADYTGKPRFNFKSYENIYLKDRRFPIKVDQFAPIYEYDEFTGYHYEPNSPVDIYVLFDLRFYENEKSRFKLLRTSYAESRTRSQLYIEKLTVYTDKEGKLPFTNLGKIGDLYNKVKNSPSSRIINREGQGFTSYALPGHHGTYDYSDTPGNRLSDDPFPFKKIFFDVFIDADGDKHFDERGHYYPIIGKGFQREDSDFYLYPETPSFAVELNTIRSFKSCCMCEENSVQQFNLGDISDCKSYCEKAGQETLSWNKGDCDVEEGGTFLPYEDYGEASAVEESAVEESALIQREDAYDLTASEYANEDAEAVIKELEKENIEGNINSNEEKVNFDKAKFPILIFVVLIVIIASIAIAKGKK